MLDADAIRDGGRSASTKDLRAEGEVKFIDDAGAKERVVEFGAAFAEETFDFPAAAQFTEGAREVDLSFSTNDDVVSKLAKGGEFLRSSALGRENDER